ncbi:MULTISPECIES: translocation/assembly module TamB domain-containing protein [Dyella]|uniref:Pathogenicity protein n=2 Tax=Dyella TaxID=231454 RepID=A0A4R0YP77_9GAMM|nr:MULTISPECIES: translocation/assembly module TamB domain-containing protein [Dyella]TBR37105.1 pathogenicity protein [Dyella terrae]TCI07805.1 pathogenicity protein [Dyella soli]
MTDHTQQPAPRPRRRWLRWTLLSLLGLLVVLACFVGWLIGTSSGLRFALARAQGFTDGALSVKHAQGRLVGPLDIEGLRYNDGKAVDVTVAKAHLDLRVLPLLRKSAHVLDLNVDGVDVALKTTPPEPPTESSFSLKPPLDLILDRIHVGSVKVTQDGAPVFASNSLDLAGSWTSQGIELHQLSLKAPDGNADLQGQLSAMGQYKGQGKAVFAWRVAGTDYAGALEAQGDGKNATVTLKLTLPMPAELHLQLQQSGAYPWTAKLDAPTFDPKVLLGESSLKQLGVSLQGSGDRRSGTVNGRVELNDYQLDLKPLQARFSEDLKTLELQQLALASPQFTGSANVHGTVALSDQPVSANLDVSWDNVRLPATLVGQDLDTKGKLLARGSADRFHAEGEVQAGPPSQLSKFTLNIDGTPKLITLNSLAIQGPKSGHMDAKGSLTLQPEFGWNLQAQAEKLDPGQIFAGWGGSMDFDIATEGTLPKNQPDATLEIRKLTGRLRERQLRGEGKLHLAPSNVVDGKLQLASGSSTITVEAKPGKSNDIQLQLAVASLADWLPNSGGALQGDFRVRGLYPKLSVNGQLHGRSLGYGDEKVAALQLTADVPDISTPGGKLDVTATTVEAGGLAFQQISLRGDGTGERHNLHLDAHGTQLSTQIALNGSLKEKNWNGTLSTLTLEAQHLPPFRLTAPSKLAYNDGAMSLSDLCLSGGEPQLCVNAKQDKAGNLDASYNLRSLPLALIMTMVESKDMPMRADGVLEGSGNIKRNAAGALNGQASITSTQGSITLVQHADRPILTYRNLALNANLTPNSQRFNIHANLSNDGLLDGQIGITGAQQALDGQVRLHVTNLALVEMFTSELDNVKGKLDGDFLLGGTVKQPAIRGQAVLDGFATEIPNAGLKLKEGHVAITTTDAQNFRVDGTVQSGKGSLTVAGTARLGEGGNAAITVKGSQFTATNIPAAVVVVSPDLTLDQNEKGITVGGSVTLDSADIDVDKLPGGGATQASPDVVIVDEDQQAEKASKLPIMADIAVNLGNKTHLVGMGLDGNLSGQLRVRERPGTATTGQGQITVDGTYRAHGQNLHIEQGRLLFATTPIDNPGLDIRAVRNLNPNATIDEGQKVGLQITGTAKRPVLTVFSNPVMEQSDALSYLITGKPLSQVKGGEGSAVGAAAQALGSAAGDMLAKTIGARMGVDDIGVQANDAIGGGSAFTVGKYLSPRLYLSYGVGLFDPGQVITLRYIFNHRWNFEALNATDFNRASLNYRIEK